MWPREKIVIWAIVIGAALVIFGERMRHNEIATNQQQAQAEDAARLKKQQAEEAARKAEAATAERLRLRQEECAKFVNNWHDVCMREGATETRKRQTPH